MESQQIVMRLPTSRTHASITGIGSILPSDSGAESARQGAVKTAIGTACGLALTDTLNLADILQLQMQDDLFILWKRRTMRSSTHGTRNILAAFQNMRCQEWVHITAQKSIYVVLILFFRFDSIIIQFNCYAVWAGQRPWSTVGGEDPRHFYYKDLIWKNLAFLLMKVEILI